VRQSSDWRQQITASIDVARARHTEVVRALAELVDRGRELGSEASAGAQQRMARARARLESLPRTIVDDARERLNFLALATRHDVEMESRRNRKRLTTALNDLNEAERARDDRLRESLVSSLREQLETFASALSDEAFLAEPTEPAGRRPSTRARSYLDELDDDDEDDLFGSDELYDDDAIDLTMRSELRSGPFDD
jgi:hypothetical protein